MFRAFSSTFFFHLFCCLLTTKALACGLDSTREYVSLAGPVTHLLEEFKLLKDPSLKGISVFHPVSEGSVPKLAGGIFLSAKTLGKYQKAIIFFDESRELKRSLERNGVDGAIEVVTRGMDPFKANNVAFAALRPYLKDCAKEIKKLEEKIRAVKDNVSNIKFGDRPYIFFLGEFKKGSRPPELLIVNDSFVKYLKEKNSMNTYPGDLAYLPWSQKKLARLENKISLGIVEGDKAELKVEQVEKDTYNLYWEGILSPGLRQIYFLNVLAQSNLVEKISGEI